MSDKPQALIHVVEDDAAVSRLITATLERFGYRHAAFSTGGDFLRQLRVQVPDVAILDLGLPDMDGMEVLQQLRSRYRFGLLIATGRDDTHDRVMGLELGGDDYVIKPFEPRELVARIRSILRRRTAIQGSPGNKRRRFASFLGWKLDCAANMLTAPDGSEHLLGTAETQVLRCFVERPHQILTREQLMGNRDLLPTDRSIDVRISRLRKRIEPDAGEPAIIKTVYGAGYMFSADVSWS